MELHPHGRGGNESRMKAAGPASKTKYILDMESFWLCDKFRIIAELNTIDR